MFKEKVNDLACELLDSIVSGREDMIRIFGISTYGNERALELAERLHELMLLDSVAMNEHKYWDTTKENTLQILWQDEKIYKFSAFWGTRPYKPGEPIIQKILHLKYYKKEEKDYSRTCTLYSFDNRDNKTSEELAGYLLDAVIIEKDEIDNGLIAEKEFEKLAKRLHSSMLKGIKSSYSSKGWTSTDTNSMQVSWQNGKTYEFSAFHGYQFGGSEGYYEDNLTVFCTDNNKTQHSLYSSSYYIR